MERAAVYIIKVRMKKLIVCDLDGTLAESKQPLSYEMNEALTLLLEKYSVAIISGGPWKQFQTQFLDHFLVEEKLQKKLYLFPTCGASFYQFKKEQWEKIYSYNFSALQKEAIMEAFKECFKQVGFEIPAKPKHGEILEDRDSQITFSALGQHAPLESKKKWDPNHLKRLEMIGYLQVSLGKDYEIRSGGTSSIDVTLKGIDKAFGIQKMVEYLGFELKDMLGLGDHMQKGGNDYPMKIAGIDTQEVTGPKDTLKIIEELLGVSK
jgi:HAD superfamily hydrolase (TIGR01484 family)